MTNRTTRGILTAALLLWAVGPALANHYPDVPPSVRRKDRSVLQSIGRLANGYTEDLSLAEGECNCFELSCDDGHFMLSCGGEMEPYYGGAITAARRNGRDTCLVCGCAWSPAVLHASPVCIGF